MAAEMLFAEPWRNSCRESCCAKDDVGPEKKEAMSGDIDANSMCG